MFAKLDADGSNAIDMEEMKDLIQKENLPMEITSLGVSDNPMNHMTQ